jgi:L-arabinose isomerase
VARVLWKPAPDLETAATAWLLAGGAHHTVYSQALTTELVEDFADIAGIEMLVIDHDTRLRAFKELIRSNEVYYHLFRFRT